MINADPIAEGEMVDVSSQVGNNTGGFMSRNHPFSLLRPLAAAMIFVEVAATESGSFHLNNHLSWPRLWLRKLAYLNFTLAYIDNTSHRPPPIQVSF